MNTKAEQILGLTQENLADARDELAREREEKALAWDRARDKVLNNMETLRFALTVEAASSFIVAEAERLLNALDELHKLEDEA